MFIEVKGFFRKALNSRISLRLRCVAEAPALLVKRRRKGKEVSEGVSDIMNCRLKQEIGR